MSDTQQKYLCVNVAMGDCYVESSLLAVIFAISAGLPVKCFTLDIIDDTPVVGQKPLTLEDFSESQVDRALAAFRSQQHQLQLNGEEYA